MRRIEVSDETYETLKNLKNDLKDRGINCKFNDIIVGFHEYLEENLDHKALEALEIMLWHLRG